MKAAYIGQTGPVDSIVVGDLPKPKVQPGQVLVRVRAVAFNPIDLYVRSGAVAMPLTFPYVVGTDFAGVVEALGAGASKFQVGDQVWGSNQGLAGRQGAASEYAAIDENLTYRTPDGQTDVEAAGQALVGITAHLGLFSHGKLKRGETIYVPGGSGGVGSMVVQMAKAVGARVVTSAGSPDRVELCRTLGADLALNYKTDDIPTRLRKFAPEGVDVWFETQREPNLEISIPLLRLRGRMIIIAGRTAKPILPIGSFYSRDCSLLGFAMFNASPDEQQHAANEISQWVKSGHLKPLIGRTFPLDDAAKAQRVMEENTVGGGKVVLEVG